MTDSISLPRVLRAGDKVAIVAPAGPVQPERLEAGLQVLRGWGLQPQVYPHVLTQTGFLAGTDAQRSADLCAALTDPSISAVLCARGGYGVQRILATLDYSALRQAPKLLMGFSDITALHGALWRHAGWRTVHGPVIGQLGEGGATAEAARQVLMSAAEVQVHADPTTPTYRVQAPGRAEGILLGGNLTMLASALGTVYMPDLRGAVLLLEDVGEAPYRIDRVLTQLLSAGAFEQLAGIVIGQFECRDSKYGVVVEDVLMERLHGLGVPILGGLPIGHGTPNVAVPLGSPAFIDVNAGVLTVQAAGVDR